MDSFFNSIEIFTKKYPNFFHIILFILILSLSLLLSQLVNKGMNKYINKIKQDSKAHSVELTYINFIKNISKAVVWILGLFFAMRSIPKLHDFSTSLFTSAGVIAAIIGFASQTTISNFVSGVFIVLFKPLRVDDYVEIDGKQSGYVEDITLRHTILRNILGQRVVVPNSTLNTATIVNYNLKEDASCCLVEFVLDINQKVDEPMQIIVDTITQHPKLYDRRTPEEKQDNTPLVPIRIARVDEKGILVRAYGWTNSFADAGDLHIEVMLDIMHKFQKADIKLSSIVKERLQ